MWLTLECLPLHINSPSPRLSFLVVLNNGDRLLTVLLTLCILLSGQSRLKMTEYQGEQVSKGPKGFNTTADLLTVRKSQRQR